MKKLFVVVVSEFHACHLDSPEIFHIRATDSGKAVECAKAIFVEDFSFDPAEVEEDFDFFAYELDDAAIIDA